MNKKIKSFWAALTASMVMAISLIGCAGSASESPEYGSFEKIKYYDTSKAVVDNGNKTFTDTTAAAVVGNMKFGWNLGNTLDAIQGDEKTGRTDQPHNAGVNSEICWGQPTTTKAMFQLLKNSGIKTVRIPTSWSNHIIDDNYTIDPAWMNRVKQVVDWAIECDLYVILNDHHDNVKAGTLTYARGYCPNESDMDESQRFLYNIWCQIATAFNNGYDEHLIFETINEPRLPDDIHEWGWNKNCENCKTAMRIVSRYNQLCLDAIRESQGNNAKRIVMFPAYVAAPYAAIEGKTENCFKIPTDSATNRLALSVHMYTPYNFAMESPGSSELTSNHKSDLASHFTALNSTFISQGIPVVIGEMGATNKDNFEARKEWFTYYLGLCKTYNVAAVLWDNGNEKNKENGSESFGFMNRKANGGPAWFTDSKAAELITAAVEARG